MLLHSLGVLASFALSAPDSTPPTKARGDGGLAGAFCACDADFNGDGVVDGDDLGTLLGAWGGAGGDLDGSGSTDGSDLGTLLGLWGPCAVTASNDSCSNAIPLSGAGAVPFCTLGATSVGPPYPPGSCVEFGYDSIDSDIWYLFTAPASGVVNVSTCGADFDTRLAAYQSFFPSPTVQCPVERGFNTAIAACNDDFAPCGLDSRISFDVFGGWQYLIRVGGYEGEAGTGTLEIDLDLPGQTCETAIDLGLVDDLGVTVSGNTAPYESSTDVSPCGTDDTVAVWYRCVLHCPFESAQAAVVTTCEPFTDFDTVVTVWKGNAGGCLGDLISCNDDFASPLCQIGGLNRRSRVEFSAPHQQVIYIRVSGYQGATGNYALRIEPGCD